MRARACTCAHVRARIRLNAVRRTHSSECGASAFVFCVSVGVQLHERVLHVRVSLFAGVCTRF